MAQRSIAITLEELNNYRQMTTPQLSGELRKNEEKMKNYDREIKRLEAQNQSEWLIKRLSWKYHHRESRVQNIRRILQEREKEEPETRVFRQTATAES